MIEIRSSVVINRPIKEVFDYVAHPERHQNWQASLVEVDSNGKTGKGTTIKEVRKFMGRRAEFKGEVTEHEEGKVYRVKGQGPHNVSFDRRYTFESAEGGTRVSTEVKMDTGGAFRAAKPIVERLLKSNVQHSLSHLKEIMEAHADLHEALGKIPAHKHK